METFIGLWSFITLVTAIFLFYKLLKQYQQLPTKQREARSPIRWMIITIAFILLYFIVTSAITALSVLPMAISYIF